MQTEGTVLVETALGIVALLLVVIPFASLIQYAAHASDDVAAVHAAVREAARSRAAGADEDGISFECVSSLSDADGSACSSALERGTYVIAFKDSRVSLPFGLFLRTEAKAVARVE